MSLAFMIWILSDCVEACLTEVLEVRRFRYPTPWAPTRPLPSRPAGMIRHYSSGTDFTRYGVLNSRCHIRRPRQVQGGGRQGIRVPPPPPQQQQHAAVLRYVFGSFRTLGTLCSRFCGISEMFRGGGRCFCCRCALLHDFFSTDFRQDVRDFVAEVLWHLRSSLPCCLGVAEARFC